MGSLNFFFLSLALFLLFSQLLTVLLPLSLGSSFVLFMNGPIWITRMEEKVSLTITFGQCDQMIRSILAIYNNEKLPNRITNCQSGKISPHLVTLSYAHCSLLYNSIKIFKTFLYPIYFKSETWFKPVWL